MVAATCAKEGRPLARSGFPPSRRVASVDMATALAGLGVTEASLDAEAAERLDRDGYAPLPGVLSEAQLTAIRARLAGLLAAEGDQAGIEVHQEAGADWTYRMPLSQGRDRNGGTAGRG